MKIESEQAGDVMMVRVYQEPILDPLVVVSALDGESVERAALRGLAWAYFMQGCRYGSYSVEIQRGLPNVDCHPTSQKGPRHGSPSEVHGH